jgi:putative isomerase
MAQGYTDTYENIKKRLARGWNTWNTRSVLSHVLLPEGAALNLAVKDYASRQYLKEAFIGRKDEALEHIHPGIRTYDGAYTELTLQWQGIELTVQSGTDGEDVLLLVTPHTQHRKTPSLVVEPGLLWNRPGSVARQEDTLVFTTPTGTLKAYGTHPLIDEPNVSVQSGYLAMALNSPVGVCTGRKRPIAEIQEKLAGNKAAHQTYIASFGELTDVYAAMQTCLAWDTIYEPERGHVISPVSRIWSVNWGGYVLFDWDTYFAAYIAGLDNRDLAYANAIAITREVTERGFVPNFGTVNNVKSRDRSQPPVGSLVVRELYRKYGDLWFLEEVYEDLLTWNRWWPANRARHGLLCWGSDPYEPLVDAHFEVNSVGDWQGAAFESGLDNSPMYDGVPFNTTTHLMELADVGLNGMYVMDCMALGDIASVLGRHTEAQELRQRAGEFRAALRQLWHAERGIFLNQRTDCDEFSHRISPTNFYALLGKAPTQSQAERMIAGHFYNPAEFWGEWMMPSISRDDPAYGDQSYWRGRIWAPMNLLVYLGLRNYALPQARADLVQKSVKLLLKEWQEKGHVHENYNADTGEGCDKQNSDSFYHWGGLLGLIAFIEAGYMGKPERDIKTLD